MTPADRPVLDAFFASPHVDRWWHQDPARVGEYVEPSDATVLVALNDDRPVGMVQWYVWDDQSAAPYGLPAGSLGIDYLIGFPYDCERGFGTAMIAAVLAQLPPGDVWVTPEAANEPSCRVLEKNGFERLAVKQCDVPDEQWAGPTALYRLLR